MKNYKTLFVGLLIGFSIANLVGYEARTQKISNLFWQASEPFRLDGLIKYDETNHRAYFLELKTKLKYSEGLGCGFGGIKVFEDGEAYVSGRKTDWNWYDVKVHLPPRSTSDR